MENFIVSARKYRPSNFDTVVGQSSITTTLKNAIKNNHLAQAFLFCGPRGVGKTTCARILAKTINCENLSANTEACDQCESCKTFSSGQSLNFYELDAASNNSVDDIRALVEQVRFAPHIGRYKIYIIDEVHMLSTSAFNAFLKTLEEPPSYAIFILATTEKHKILPTILSRCQIFDFNRIQVEDIASHLASIAVKEGIAADNDALHIIAQKADGALRDSLSMFDQIVSFAGNNISYKAVIENLNILDYDYYFKLTNYILNGDISSSLLIFNDILNNGFDSHNFINGLSSHFRDLLICKDEVTLKLLEVSPGIKEQYAKQSQACTAGFLLQSLDITNKCDLQYKSAKNQRLHVELSLMKLCSDNKIKSQSPSEEEIKKKPLEPAVEIKPPVLTSVKEPQSEFKADFKLKNASAAVKTVSISEHFRKKEKVETVNDSADPLSYEKRPQKQFDKLQLVAKWKEYALKASAQGKRQFHSTLLKREPELKDALITLTIDNKVQEEEMLQEKAELLGFLREELSNYSIQLELIVSANPLENSVYTDQDKFKKMAEKNPLLNDLKKSLGLDFDY